MKKTPIKRKRSTPRRGEPSREEKAQVRRMAFYRAMGLCELDRHLGCCGGKRWPLEGDLRERGHLVHLRNRRMWGWGAQNVCWGCPHGHLDLMHTKGLQVPKTYDELVGVNEARKQA